MRSTSKLAKPQGSFVRPYYIDWKEEGMCSFQEKMYRNSAIFHPEETSQTGLNAHDTYKKEFTYETNCGTLVGIYGLATSQTSPG
jgi:hypothetical protein